MKRLILLSALLIFACSDDEGNPCVYEPTLTTEAATDITENSATLNGTIDVYSQNCDTVENVLQGFVYSISTEPTIDDTIVSVNGTSISSNLTDLEPNTTYYVRAFLVRPLIGVFYGNEVSFTLNEESCDVVYLDENGVTVKAYPCASIGDVGTVNGVEYTVVDRDMLYQMRGEWGQIITVNFTKLCTTRVTEMNALFLCYEDFNQPIGNWDTSNVTDMSGMFCSECADSQFNQDISQWDVSNVTNMSGMFSQGGVFNQDISQWIVSSVTNMSLMFSNSVFNQELGDWNVSSVTNMNSMFSNAEFNQDIGNWDVSNVANLSYMFSGSSSFNQPIGGWSVSNVNDMRGMFYDASAFNQPIGNWDVSSVTNVSFMFYNAESFNQDLGNWAVDNVLDCPNFSDETPQWTLPQPNFTNCTP